LNLDKQNFALYLYDTKMASKHKKRSVTILTSQLGRFHPFIGHEGPYREYRYSSTLFLTSALEGGEVISQLSQMKSG